MDVPTVVVVVVVEVEVVVVMHIKQYHTFLFCGRPLWSSYFQPFYVHGTLKE